MSEPSFIHRPKRPLPPEGRLIAIGDIHGEAAMLRSLLAKIAPTPADRLIFLGDYIDRGPDSRAVVVELLALAERMGGEQVIFLKGNHEVLLLDAMEGLSGVFLFLHNGGDKTVASYGLESAMDLPLLPPEHLGFFQSRPLLWVEEGFIFVHAGLRPGPLPLELQQESELLWIRDKFIASEGPFPGVVVHGHTPAPEVELLPHRIGLDTGAVFGHFGILSACDVRRGTLYQVERSEVY